MQIGFGLGFWRPARRRPGTPIFGGLLRCLVKLRAQHIALSRSLQSTTQQAAFSVGEQRGRVAAFGNADSMNAVLTKNVAGYNNPVGTPNMASGKGERPHPSFGKIVSNFTEIHLPLKGKATVPCGWLTCKHNPHALESVAHGVWIRRAAANGMEHPMFRAAANGVERPALARGSKRPPALPAYSMTPPSTTRLLGSTASP